MSLSSSVTVPVVFSNCPLTLVMTMWRTVNMDWVCAGSRFQVVVSARATSGARASRTARRFMVVGSFSLLG